MASILEFRIPPHVKPTTIACRATETPNIIIFPGVRYERWTETPPPRRKKQSKAKRAKVQAAE